MGDEFWLISAPGEKTCQQTWEKLNKMLPSNSLTENYKFHIPDLKVGTLDLLVGLSDDLAKLDTYVDGVAKKIAQYLGDIVEGQKDKLYENLLANGVDLNTYVTHFQWDTAKFPIKQSLVSLTEIISKKVSQIDNEFKVRSSHYNSLKKELDNMERKNTGSLLTRNLNDIVHKDQFVVGSEYLITLLVVVPKHMYKEWDQIYEKLTDMVVPRSSKLIFEDEENGLYTVTVFKKVMDEFKQHAREKKFIVRDFTYDEGQLATDKTEVTKLTADAKKAYAPLVRWLQVNFNEAFTSWIHVKALRVFVESVLRYGLPVNFIAMLLHPLKKNHKKVREILFQMFKHLDSTSSGPHAADNEDIPGLNYGQADYYPYVYFAISTNYVDVKK